MNTETTPIVLVADDEPSMLALVAQHMKTMGYDVLEASDGEQAWALAREHLPDMVILDVMMPGMSGWEVCRKVREDVSLAHTAVIMLTGIGENLNQMTSPLYGADSYIDKPFAFAELDSKVRTALAKRRGGESGEFPGLARTFPDSDLPLDDVDDEFSGADRLSELPADDSLPSGLESDLSFEVSDEVSSLPPPKDAAISPRSSRNSNALGGRDRGPRVLPSADADKGGHLPLRRKRAPVGPSAASAPNAGPKPKTKRAAVSPFATSGASATQGDAPNRARRPGAAALKGAQKSPKKVVGARVVDSTTKKRPSPNAKRGLGGAKARTDTQSRPLPARASSARSSPRSNEREPTASSARSTANSAKSTASSARPKANSAKSTASSARPTANSAKSKAGAHRKPMGKKRAAKQRQAVATRGGGRGPRPGGGRETSGRVGGRPGAGPRAAGVSRTGWPVTERGDAKAGRRPGTERSETKGGRRAARSSQEARVPSAFSNHTGARRPAMPMSAGGRARDARPTRPERDARPEKDKERRRRTR